MSLTTDLKTYCKNVQKDQPLSCKKHKWSCLRFLSDLERADTEDFPYVFIEEKAERFFSWVRLFKHTKGILAGKHIEFEITLKFIFGNVYGWYHRETGYRRFSKLYWQVARKNAKSQSLAGVASYETMAFDEDAVEVNEVYCAATKTEQAKIVYNETISMLRSCAALKGKYTTTYGRITHLKTGSFMRALSEEDRKTGDGLSPKCGIIDEYHAHDSSEVYDVIDSGMGARAQPLMAIITTAGFELNNPCYRVEYDLVSKILNPDNPITIDSYFVMVNELDKDDRGELVDDIKDPSVWVKANPIICSYPEGVKYLEKKLAEALLAPEKMRNFLTKHMNAWVNMRESGYMDLSKWSFCRGDFPDLDKREVYVGVDLSAKIDLTSVSFEFPIDDKYYVKSHSFMPEETVDTKRKTDRVPYDQWIHDGWITATPGAVVDYRAVRDYITDEASRNGWRIAEICMDPWGTAQIANDLEDDGYDVIEIVQGIKTLSEPTKDFREMAFSNRMVHNGNPVLTWSIGNAIVDVVDRNENIILNKKKSSQRIDPIASVINAHVRAMLHKELRPTRVIFI